MQACRPCSIDAAKFFHELQSDLCGALSDADGTRRSAPTRGSDPAAVAGVTRVLEGGALFEKAGVNWSNVEGDLPTELADHMPGTGRTFRATGVSLVLHPRSPMVPTMHANFRCLEQRRQAWFGGGADLTPYYPFRDDAVHFHRTLPTSATARPSATTSASRRGATSISSCRIATSRAASAACSSTTSAEGRAVDSVFALRARSSAIAFLDAYLPIVAPAQATAVRRGRARRGSCVRRGRYVEFNLIYDRGTLFGLKTGGRDRIDPDVAAAARALGLRRDAAARLARGRARLATATDTTG